MVDFEAPISHQGLLYLSKVGPGGVYSRVEGVLIQRGCSFDGALNREDTVLFFKGRLI